jgi:hypothetical protein
MPMPRRFAYAFRRLFFATALPPFSPFAAAADSRRRCRRLRRRFRFRHDTATFHFIEE